MRHASPSPRPPRLAAWLVSLFGSPEQAESILGDLAEEFSDIASKSGVAYARRWYWRHSLKTVAHLASAAFRMAPSSLVGVVVLGFLLRWFSAALPERLVVAILRTQRPYSNLHVEAYIRFVTYGIPVAHVIVSTLVGCVVAFAAKGREMVADATLSLVICGLIVAALARVATLGPKEVWWILWSCTDLFAIVLGGVIVREIRSAIACRLLHT